MPSPMWTMPAAAKPPPKVSCFTRYAKKVSMVVGSILHSPNSTLYYCPCSKAYIIRKITPMTRHQILPQRSLFASVSENGGGDGNIDVFFDDVFCSAQRYILCKKRGKNESIFTLISATDKALVHHLRCGQPSRI